MHRYCPIPSNLKISVPFQAEARQEEPRWDLRAPRVTAPPPKASGCGSLDFREEMQGHPREARTRWLCWPVGEGWSLMHSCIDSCACSLPYVCICLSAGRVAVLLPLLLPFCWPAAECVCKACTKQSSLREMAGYGCLSLPAFSVDLSQSRTVLA